MYDKDVTRTLQGRYRRYRRYKDVTDVTQTLQGRYCQIVTNYEAPFTKYDQNDQRHVQTNQECNFLRLKKCKIERVAKNVIFSYSKNDTI